VYRLHIIELYFKIDLTNALYSNMNDRGFLSSDGWRFSNLSTFRDLLIIVYYIYWLKLRLYETFLPRYFMYETGSSE